jgi:WD40 repeat protein
VTPPRLRRWPIALLSLAWSLLLPVSAPAERPDVFWMRGGHAHSATAVAYSPDGSIVASGGDDGAIKLWRGVDGMLLRTLTGHQAPPPGDSAPAMIQSPCRSRSI